MRGVVTDHAGQVFGRLTVLERAPNPNPKGRDVAWRCRCECGSETVVLGHNLRASQVRSCGCLSAELAGQRLTKHGAARGGNRSPTYQSWQAMRERCTNPNTIGWRYYGGRGITVCERWDDFRVFLADMGERPGDDYSLDRIDGNGNYEPGNVRWATAREQANNRRRTRCRRGHQLTPENTIMNPNGGRTCRQCKAERQRERRAQQP